MAKIDSTITVKWGTRPCMVGDKRAQFHIWGVFAQPHTALMIGMESGQIAYMYGIVEYEDGTVDKVDPTDIKFCEG